MSQPDLSRRRFHRPGELLHELFQLARDRQARVPAAFPERLIVAVTGINRCRYFAAFHGRLALRQGISREDDRFGCDPGNRA